MKHIILATDFSDNAWRAMSYAAQLFSDTPCHFQLLTSSRVPINVLDSGIPVDLNEVISNHQKSLDKLLIKFKELDHHESSTFKRSAVVGTTCQCINNAIEEIDDLHSTLTVIGSHGASGLADKLLGTTSSDILSHCNSAVLCVPENCSLSHPKKVLLASDNNIQDKPNAMKSLTAFISILKAELLVANVREEESIFTDDSPEKILADHFFSEIPHSFHTLTGSKVTDELVYFCNKQDIDMMVLLKKDEGFFSQLFRSSNIKTLNYYGNRPILVI